jgi:hypothetical protein
MMNTPGIKNRAQNKLRPSSMAAVAPPAGYIPEHVVRYPALAVNLASVAILCIITPLLIWLTSVLQAMTVHAFALPLTLEDLLLGWSAMIVTVGVHEAIHVVIIRVFGYHASCGFTWRQLAAYAGAFGQWQLRRHALLITLAPLVVITAVAIPFLGAPQRSLVVVGFSALLANTSGVAGDLYVTWQLLRLPRQALIYDVDPTQMLIGVPARS